MTEDTIPQKLQELITLSKEVYADKEIKSWLFAHTRSEEEYRTINRALFNLENINPVVWSGNPGARFYTPIQGN